MGKLSIKEIFADNELETKNQIICGNKEIKMEYQRIIGEINKHLYRTTERLSAWLFRVFKKNDNYWRDFVLAKLSDNQRAIIEQRGFREFSDIDLAALLLLKEVNLAKIKRSWQKR